MNNSSFPALPANPHARHKAALCHRLNILGFIDQFGLDHRGLLTLVFARHVRWKHASANVVRAQRTLLDRLIAEYFGNAVVDAEVTSLSATAAADSYEAPLPLATLEDPATRAEVQAAHVVLGVDHSTMARTLFYGKAALENVVRRGRPKDLSVISFLYDSRTDELERFHAAVQVLKGSCFYEGRSENPGGARR